MSPNNPPRQADYATTLMRTQDYKQAYRIYTQLLCSLGVDNMPDTALDGLAEVCGWLGDKDLLRRYGNLSLTVADRKFSQLRAYALPDAPPPSFDSTAPERNLILFSLFGARPRCCDNAIMNVEAARELFPHWRCRFYIDDTVPQAVRERLAGAGAGAQVVQLDEATRAAIPATMWRFWLMDESEVSRVQVRDADSLLSERDRAAVEAWLESERWYHHMRDYFSHPELLLAGMWAGCHNPALPSVRQLIAQYLQEEEAHQRFADQYFLRRSLWPTIRQSLLSHDELFGFMDALPTSRSAGRPTPSLSAATPVTPVSRSKARCPTVDSSRGACSMRRIRCSAATPRRWPPGTGASQCPTSSAKPSPPAPSACAISTLEPRLRDRASRVSKPPAPAIPTVWGAGDSPRGAAARAG